MSCMLDIRRYIQIQQKAKQLEEGIRLIRRLQENKLNRNRRQQMRVNGLLRKADLLHQKTGLAVQNFRDPNIRDQTTISERRTIISERLTTAVNAAQTCLQCLETTLSILLQMWRGWAAWRRTSRRTAFRRSWRGRRRRFGGLGWSHLGSVPDRGESVHLNK
jgi:hypothetical protein